MRAHRALPALLVGLLALTGCGLPLPSGVQSGGGVPATGEEPPALRVIPPGPQPGATAEELVAGFLVAQGSPEDDHAVARQFLAPGTAWDDEEGAVVYRGRRVVADDDTDAGTVAVRFDTTARIEPTGAFNPDVAPVTAGFTAAEQPDGQLRLTAVPRGLFLTAQDRDRSFTPYDVHFLAQTTAGQPVDRLVADRVFLPVTADRAAALVEALLRGPTIAIGAAVRTAVPREVELASPVTVVDGVVTVDLTAPAADLSTVALRRLSAQLVWTLVPEFTGVRLLVEGAPVFPDVLDRSDRSAYDPAGSVAGAPVVYVRDRQLRVLDGTLPVSEATTAGGLAVDEAAVSPTSGALGLLTRTPGGDEVRTGPRAGPFGAPVLRRASLGSLSWGPGDQGLWVLDRGSPASGAQPAICLLAPGGPPASDPCTVPYERPADAGPLTALQVSRDGARVALVFGEGEARRLYVGRVEPTGPGVRISALDPVAPSLSDVTDVAWAGGTSLAVLAASGASQVVVWTVPVDGSAPPAAVQQPGLPGDARAVAAAPGRPLVVSADVDGRSRLYREDGTLFQLQAEAGDAPRYPG